MATDRKQLEQAIRTAEGLTPEERAALLQLLHTKKYGLVWEEKPENAEEKLRDHLPVLKEDKSLAITDGGVDAPNHIIIEGDNLEALTTLTYTHEGKIDVIYIDPPYNTGNKDFVYNDVFVDKEDEFRHSKWLSFMSKRLRMAKRLLSDKGVIFISIDDNEQANLKLLCDEVFGENNFVATIPWRKRTAKSDVPYSLSQDYEWIQCYANVQFKAGIKKGNRKYYETPDLPGQPWRIHDMTKQCTATERPNSDFTIINPKNGKEYPVNKQRVWCVTKDTFQEYYKQNRIVFPGDYAFLKISKPVLRYFKSDDEKKTGERFGFATASTYLPTEVGMSEDGTKDIISIYGEKCFSHPKPISLIKYILQISTVDILYNPTILDFFAGSGTTLHATMQLNAEDGGNRQCIMVNITEASDKEPGKNICRDVTYERNRRVIQGYTTPKGDKVEGLAHNNLRYYRVSSDEVNRNGDTVNLRKLAMYAIDMLCIKEDIYDKQEMFGTMATSFGVQYYESNGKGMLVVLDTDEISAVVEQLKAMRPQQAICVYVFASGAYAYDDEFTAVADKVQLRALPEAIASVYRRVLPQQKALPLDDSDATSSTNLQNTQE